jgi:hypothetical protein
LVDEDNRRLQTEMRDWNRKTAKAEDETEKRQLFVDLFWKRINECLYGSSLTESEDPRLKG